MATLVLVGGIKDEIQIWERQYYSYLQLMNSYFGMLFICFFILHYKHDYTQNDAISLINVILDFCACKLGITKYQQCV